MAVRQESQQDQLFQLFLAPGVDQPNFPEYLSYLLVGCMFGPNIYLNEI